MIKAIHASQLARPMECAGSLFMDKLDTPIHPAAAEGTAAGEYLEKLLTNQEIGTHASNGEQFDDDMKFYASHLAREIRELAGDAEITCETKIDWSTYAGVKIKGKYDISFAMGDTLYVDDLKYGYGIVEAPGNWQLIAYAIGEVIRRNTVFENIVMRIHQPRAHHEDGTTREWRLTYGELLGYKEQIENRMTEIVNGKDDLKTGEHCKYCPSASNCPAFSKAFHNAVDVIDNYTNDHLSGEQISYQLDLVSRIEDLVKMRKTSLEQLATDRIKRGELVPGYAITESFGNREWSKEITPEAIKVMTGKDITERKILTPAKAEKIGVPVELVKSMTTRKSKGFNVKKVKEDLGDKMFGNQAPKLLINKEADNE